MPAGNTAVVDDGKQMEHMFGDYAIIGVWKRTCRMGRFFFVKIAEKGGCLADNQIAAFFVKKEKAGNEKWKDAIFQ